MRTERIYVYDELAKEYMENDADNLKWLEASEDRHIEIIVHCDDENVITSCGYILHDDANANDAPEIADDTVGALTFVRKTLPEMLKGLKHHIMTDKGGVRSPWWNYCFEFSTNTVESYGHNMSGESLGLAHFACDISDDYDCIYAMIVEWLNEH